jgi:hypothetical protein
MDAQTNVTTLAGSFYQTGFANGLGNTPPSFITSIVRRADETGLINVDRSRNAQNPIITLKTQAPSLPEIQKTAPKPPDGSSPQRRSEHFFDILRRLDLGPFSVIRSHTILHSI